MKCPSCNSNVADDAAVCPKCDHILDPSLFSDEPPPDPPARPKAAKGGTGTQKPLKRPAAAGASTGAKKPPAGAKKDAPPRRMMPDAPARKVKTPPEQRAPVEDWHSAPRPLADAPVQLQSQAFDPEEGMGDARNFIVALSTSDKIAFFGAVLTLIACFMPWRETATEEESLGLLSLGALVFGAQVALIGAIVVRVRKVMPRLNALVPWLLQFGTSSFSIVWCLVLIKLAVNTTKARAMYGNEEVWVSKPGFGVLLALLTSIAGFAGTLMGLREKPD
jgi:hypothetical protein